MEHSCDENCQECRSIVYICSKCGHKLVVKPGQITTSDVKMHCGLIMQVQKHPEPYKPQGMEYK